MANYSWRVIDGDFGLAVDWTVNGATATVGPGTADAVTFGSGTTGTVTGIGNVASISFNNTVSNWIVAGQVTAVSLLGTGGFNIASGGKLTLTGQPNSNPAFNFSGTLSGNVAVTGGTLDSSGGGLDVGGYLDNTGVPGALVVQSASTVLALSSSVGRGSTGSVTVSGTGSVLRVAYSADTSNGFLTFGNNQTLTGGALVNGTGHLVISSGGAVFADNLSIGNDAGSTADATLSGGATLTVRSGTAIGSNGIGTMSISGGSVVTTATSGATQANGSTNYDFLGSNAGAAGTLTIDGAGSKWNSGNQFIVGNSGTGTATLTNGAGLTAGIALVVGQLAGSSGQLTLTSGSTAASGGTITVGNTAGSSGTLNINAGSSLRGTAAAQSANYMLRIGLNAASNGLAAAIGVVNVSGSGALLDMGGNGASVGQGGTGTLAISAGGAVKFAALNPGSSGTTEGLAIGRAGSGTVTVDGAGSTLQVAGAFYAGRASGSVGALSLSNGASFTETLVTSADPNQVGNSGTVNGTVVTGGVGTFTVASGSTATLGNQLQVGQNGAFGTTTVTGTGSTLTVGDAVHVGGGAATALPSGTAGAGTLNVTAGGVLRFTAASDTSRSFLQVGNSALATGTATVSGAGSLLDVGANSLSVGLGGIGTLTVSGGGTVKSASADSRIQSALSAGSTSSGSGSVTVTGAGSTLDALGYVFFGRGGSGTLLVDQGGVFTGGKALTGDGTGANEGESIVIGSGQRTTNTNALFGGSGSVQVMNGSTLHSRYGITVGYDGVAGTLLVDNSLAYADRTISIANGPDRPGSGTVTLQNGGILRAGGLHVAGLAGISIGGSAGNIGIATVTGVGSLLDANGDRLSIGTDFVGSTVSGTGSGSLTISAGGRAVAGASYTDTEAALAVGAFAREVGTALVTGAGSQLVVSGLAVLGGSNTGAGVAAGGTGSVAVGSGGLFRASNLAMFAGSSVTVDGTSIADVGGTAGVAGRLTIEAAASLAAVGGSINGDVRDDGAISNSGGTLAVSGNVTGAGAITLGAGLMTVGGTLGGEAVSFTALASTLRVHGLAGAGTVANFQKGDSIDLAGITNASLSTSGGVTTLAAGGGTLNLGSAPAGTVFKLFGDGQGGQQVLLDSPPLQGGVAWTDVTANTSFADTATAYTGPVDYLQEQYIWANSHNVAISDRSPNSFLKGGAGGDALQVFNGNNVLDGGGGSNFLIGGTGADGDNDTFFVDSRGSVETWSTIVNFHPGDQATIFGFHPGVSTLPYTASDGAAGYTGLTIHSEINGAGTGILGSMTFTGITQATADAHFSITTGTLLPGTTGAIDYLLIQYNR